MRFPDLRLILSAVALAAGTAAQVLSQTNVIRYRSTPEELPITRFVRLVFHFHHTTTKLHSAVGMKMPTA
jgi:hypothetical protein